MSHGRNAREGRLASRAARGLRRTLAAAVQIPAIVILAAAPAAATSPGVADAPSAVLCSGYAACASLGYDSHGYPTHGGTSYWQMTAGDECTNYVAYVEATVFGAPTPDYLLGNAGQWPASAAEHGVTVNDVPSVGAVAEWDGGAYGIGPEGHVAIVEKVGPHDGYILISQQHIGSDVNGFDWTQINAGFPADSWQSWPDHFIHFPIKGSASVGYYDPQSGSLLVRDVPTAGPASRTFRLGPAGVVPLTGDWTGHGTASGYYDPRTGSFHLREDLGSGPSLLAFGFGPPGMVPLVGDWAGTGRDGVGYYDPQDGSFHLRADASGGPASYSFTFGPPGMVPLVGDWAGIRRDGVGYYNPRTARFYLRTILRGGPASYSFTFGPAGEIPVVGNWTGGARADIGYYDPRTGWFHLRDGLTRGRVSYAFRFGPRGMIPLAGDWLG
jgi:surface antigen